MIAQFTGALLYFQPWFLWKPERYLIHFRKNIRRQKVYVGKRWWNYLQVTKSFFGEYFLPIDFSIDEIFTTQGDKNKSKTLILPG